MWSKRPILYVCLLVAAALALAMTSQLAGQSSGTATEAPFLTPFNVTAAQLSR